MLHTDPKMKLSSQRHKTLTGLLFVHTAHAKSVSDDCCTSGIQLAECVLSYFQAATGLFDLCKKSTCRNMFINLHFLGFSESSQS